jgi:hypothetical protein
MMHEKTREYLIGRLRVAERPGWRDHLLDQLYDSTYRATEWDAEQWGFDAAGWMKDERAAMRARKGRDWPSEVI